MTIGKHVGLDNYCFANYAFDRESAAVNFWRYPLNHYTTLSIRRQYFFHSCSLSLSVGTEYPAQTWPEFDAKLYAQGQFFVNFASKH